MSNQEYIDKLTGGIGRVLLSTDVSDSFPMMGDTVTLEAITKWAQRTHFTKRSKPDESIEEIINNTTQRVSTTIPITMAGELKQEIRSANYRGDQELFSASMLRYIYAMERQTLPYHDVAVSCEVIRTDQNFTLKLSGDNGYDLSRECDLSVHILAENGSESRANEILITLSRESFTLSDGVLVSSLLNIPTRGIYDVETRYKDIDTGEIIRKRINKLITVTPRLAAAPTDGQTPFGVIDSGMAQVDIKMYKTGVNDLYMVFDIPNTDYYPEINMSKVPSGYDAYTLVLTKPTVEDDNVISRVRLTCDMINGNPSQSPTPQFTREHPLVITHRGNTPLELHGATWNTMSIAGVRNLVVDGRGYANIEKGLKLNANPVTREKPIIAIQFSGGSSDMELFEVEVAQTAFTAIMAKTDPTENSPWWWHGNFAQDNFHMHHFYIHDTDGEGCYLGYFTPGETSVVYTGETVSFMNLKNEYVTYTKGNTYKKKAHYLTNFRFYRNVLERTGYDGVQISNSIGEVCYNVLSGCAHAEEVSQTSGMSIQSLTGKCYNNLLLDNHGPSMQIGPIGNLEIYNNIAHSKFGTAIQFLFNYDVPEQNPTRQPEGSLVVNNDISILIHNNVFATPGMTANGLNTVQMRNVHFVDNIIANNGTLVSNMTGDTLNVWQSQAIGNNISLYKDLYSTSIENKIANYTGGDYRISFNSPLINAGTGLYFKFDYRGYLNWFGSIAPIGAFMGKYKNPQINDDPISLTSVTINDGAVFANDKVVSVKMSFSGAATRYKIGETASLSDAMWQALPADRIVDYTLSDGFGQKTVYVVVGSGLIESEPVSASIEYRGIPLSLDEFVVNNGSPSSRHLDVPVSFVYSGSFAPAKYRVGETGDLSDAVWQNMTSEIRYTFSSMGQHTLHGQLQDANGNQTAIKSGSVNVEQIARKVIVSLGWNQTEIPLTTSGFSLFDSETGITKLLCQHNTTINRTIYDTIGEVFGTARPSAASINMTTGPNVKGAITGNNTGVYSDTYLEHNSVYGGNKVGSERISFTIPAGMYRVRFLANTISNSAVIQSQSDYKIVTNAGEILVALPVSGIKNNTSVLSEWTTVPVAENDTLNVVFGILGLNGTYYHAAMNVIEIEEM